MKENLLHEATIVEGVPEGAGREERKSTVVADRR